MTVHWTERSTDDYVFAIGQSFIDQLEDKMEDEGISQNTLAEELGVTKGRVSQVLNHPGNLTLGNVVRYSRALGMKASIIAYEDNDPENKRGPVNSRVFTTCWEKCGKPHDSWDLERVHGSSFAGVYGVQVLWQALGTVFLYMHSATQKINYSPEHISSLAEIMKYDISQNIPLPILPSSSNKATGGLL